MSLCPDIFREVFLQWGRGGSGTHPGMDWGYGTHWFGGVLMIIFWVAVIVGIIVLIRWLILSTRSGDSGKAHRDAALEILRERYARGEIEREEFEQRKKDLRG